MARDISLGSAFFTEIRERGDFYIDKTGFIRDWWSKHSDVTLITRPRRFGKTLAMSMVEAFFSPEYAGRSDLFEGLDIWKDEKYRKLQGTIPVISLNFGGVRPDSFERAVDDVKALLEETYSYFSFLKKSDKITDENKIFFSRVTEEMKTATALVSLRRLSQMLVQYYGRRPIILIDEYDVPMQEAWLHGYWNELVLFMKALFDNTVKDNKNFERAILTGVTRVAKESIFSGLNNLDVVTTTTPLYETAFGFTTQEVETAMAEFGLDDMAEIRRMYDGFTFGQVGGIYNPWSITNYLSKKTVTAWWANSSGNDLIAKLVRDGSPTVRQDFEALLRGESITARIDEEIEYGRLNKRRESVWGLCVASGYLRIEMYDRKSGLYKLVITNGEVREMLDAMILSWVENGRDEYERFLEGLVSGNVTAVNIEINNLTLAMFSFFDTAGKETEEDARNPERFYHGFVLGLLVTLRKQYKVTSNREGGTGRYDVMLAPRDITRGVGIILEFKVHDEKKETTMEETAESALRQIDERRYDVELLEQGIPAERILKYGFAFNGKKVFPKMECAPLHADSPLPCTE